MSKVFCPRPFSAERLSSVYFSRQGKPCALHYPRIRPGTVERAFRPACSGQKYRGFSPRGNDFGNLLRYIRVCPAQTFVPNGSNGPPLPRRTFSLSRAEEI